MKMAPRLILTVLTLLGTAAASYAAPGPPPPQVPPGPPGFPLDENLFIMLILAVSFGLYKIFKAKKALN